MPIRAVLPGYPIYPGGSKKLSVFDLKGLATYTPGGETIQAKQFGEGGIDIIEPINKQWLSVTQGGVATYQMVPASLGTTISPAGTYFVTVALAINSQTGAVTSVTIKWYVTATGAEAGAIDLSAETVRLLAVFV
jgi:hypothetical protein